MPKRSKERDLARHVRERFSTRFDIVLTHALETFIIKQIENGKTTFIEKQSNRVSRHRIIVEDQEIDIIYDKNRRKLVTAMYPNESDRWDQVILDG